MLSAVLKSETAIYLSIQIIDAFVEMRRFIIHNAELFSKIDTIEQRQLSFEIETKEQLGAIFQALEKNTPPKQGVFFDWQIFDAYSFCSDLIRLAKKSLMLFDNYIDDSVLTLLSKRQNGVRAIIYTKSISKQLALDLKRHNAQYQPIEIRCFDKFHDRFLIIDDKQLYHFGASLKDLGKKWFAFTKMEVKTLESLNKRIKKMEK